MIFEQNKEHLLFLLDDIGAELDYKHIGQLLESVIEKFGANAQIFTIENGATKII